MCVEIIALKFLLLTWVSEDSHANYVEMRKCVEEKDKKIEEFNCRCVKVEWWRRMLWSQKKKVEIKKMRWRKECKMWRKVKLNRHEEKWKNIVKTLISFGFGFLFVLHLFMPQLSISWVYILYCWTIISVNIIYIIEYFQIVFIVARDY
jgi:hypothetical protein